mmetsp:Transcript_6186/g.14229  ORF Transcript_6186/g.14229 Transcript_6186/m.14229 type:complete len:97 (+) Transcript_6186:713-1003(+)
MGLAASRGKCCATLPACLDAARLIEAEIALPARGGVMDKQLEGQRAQGAMRGRGGESARPEACNYGDEAKAQLPRPRAPRAFPSFHPPLANPTVAG